MIFPFHAGFVEKRSVARLFETEKYLQHWGKAGARVCVCVWMYVCVYVQQGGIFTFSSSPAV